MFLANEIQERITNQNFQVFPFDIKKSLETRERILLKFFKGNNLEILWNQFLEDSGFCIRDELAWKWLEDFLFQKDVVVFFDKTDDEFIYNIPNHASKISFLQEFILYTFYITNENLDFLIYFNDSNYLRCIGTAEPWLRNKAIELSKTGWKDQDGFYWDENGVKKR